MVSASLEENRRVGRLRRVVDATLGYAERLAGRGDGQYMKQMSALFAIGAGIGAYYARPAAMITFSATSIGFAVLVVALRWAKEGAADGVSPSQGRDKASLEMRRLLRQDTE